MTPIVTLLTDFGTADTYAAQMKGVILGLCAGRADATIVDLTHAAEPQNVMQAGLLLDAAVDSFPAGTIHIAVVDPGVGTKRRAVAVQTQRLILVGPDNGLFTPVLERETVLAAVELNRAHYHRQPVSATFHGRDIFAPAAGHLACGVDLMALGDPVDDLIRLPLPQPRPIPGGWELHVLAADHFGNLVTDLRQEHWPEYARFDLQAGRLRIRQLGRTYGDVGKGEPVAYFGSSGRLEIAISHGSAQEASGLKAGDVVTLKEPG